MRGATDEPAPTAQGLIRRELTSQRRRVVVAAVMMISHQTCEVLVPVLIGRIIDVAVVQQEPGALALWIGVLGLNFTVLLFSYRYGQRIGFLAHQLIGHGLRSRLTRTILDPRRTVHREKLPGELLSTATADADRVAEVVRPTVLGGGALGGVVVGGVIVVSISAPLGLTILLGAPLVLWVVHRLGARVRRLAATEQEAVAGAAATAADLVGGLRVIEGIRAQDAAARRYRERSQTSLRATVTSAGAVAAYEGLTVGLTSAFVAMISAFAGYLAMAGDITVGQFVSAVGVATFLLGPLQRLGVVGSTVAQALASGDRVLSVLRTPVTIAAGGQSGPGLPAPRGRIDVDGLRHGTLDGLSLTVDAGAHIGVAAADPRDAAALVDVLGRRVGPAAGSGAIRLDGVAVHDLSMEVALAGILAPPHEADLFEGTIEENVAAGVRGPGTAGTTSTPGTAGAGGTNGDRRLDAAIRASGTDEVLTAVPGGLHAHVTDAGRSLSGGQRQRVALARALAADPPVLVLHDPTTAVDAVTENAIAHGIRDLRADRTTIMITTSPALLATCHDVVFVVDGRVVATGSHADLIGRSDYRELVMA